jgi:hypothetical protein
MPFGYEKLEGKKGAKVYGRAIFMLKEPNLP